MTAAGQPTARPPALFSRVLRLRHLSPAGWQHGLLGEGVLFVAVVIALSDLASAWVLLALPAAVLAVVKYHDVLAGRLRPPASHRVDNPWRRGAPRG